MEATMTERRPSIERAVIAAMTAWRIDPQIDVTTSTEVLTVLDSMGMLSAVLEFQEALQLHLEPEEVVGIFKCRSVGDIVAALESADS
jgi:acyl carrier protein